MGLHITIELLSGSYDAADVGDREHAEWPPHPARLFCALVAAARAPSDRETLRWLEAQPLPVIVAAGQPQESRRAAYVVTNVRSDKGGNQTHPGRTNGLRSRVRALPAHPRVSMFWPGPVDEEVVRTLDGVARRVPYLGRSTGLALVSASAVSDDDGPDGNVPDSDGLDSDGLDSDRLDSDRLDSDRLGDGGLGDGGDGERLAYEPCDLLPELSVRVPYSGFLDDLDVQFDTGRPGWEVARYQGYRCRPRSRRVAALDGAGVSRAGIDRAAPSVYPDVLVFQFAGWKPQARLLVRLTEAFRLAVLRQAGNEAPAVLHGHGADGRPHVAFLALPDVGGDHSDGHLLGMAVAVPELPEHERKAVLRAVLGLRREDLSGVVELRVPGVGVAELLYQPGLVRPWGASPERWQRGSRRWVTATPVVLDRYPKRPALVEEFIRASLRTVGLPDPVDLQLSREPLLVGAARLLPSDLPRQSQKKLFRHVAATFERPVNGPVLAGAGRYLGVGLFAPPVGGSDG